MQRKTGLVTARKTKWTFYFLNISFFFYVQNCLTATAELIRLCFALNCEC